MHAVLSPPETERVGLRRIAVVGAPGSGKTTLARQIAGRLELPYVEADGMFFEPDGGPAPREVYRARVEAALSGDEWVMDGGGPLVRDLIWGRAELVVWLDYALPLVAGRLLRRGSRHLSGDTRGGAGGSGRPAPTYRRALLLWLRASKKLLRSLQIRREYPRLIESAEYGRFRSVRLRSPRATEEWLSGLSRTAASR